MAANTQVILDSLANSEAQSTSLLVTAFEEQGKLIATLQAQVAELLAWKHATEGSAAATKAEIENQLRAAVATVRRESAGGTTFATLLESHGRYDGAAEQTVASRSRVAAMRHERQGGKDIVVLTLKDGGQVALAVSHDTDPGARHSATVDGREIAWSGFAAIVEIGRGGN